MTDPAKATPTVLIIDDSEIALEWIAAILEDAGWNPVTSPTPFLDAAELASLAPDLVLLDLGLHGVTDEDIPGLVRSLGGSGARAVVLHSGRREDELAEIAAATGAEGYLCKGGDDEALVEALARYRP